ncbi:MAG: hypothetical protein KKF00_11385 [Proteobacteria bacterium]|nr:hypothetical protein [Pseudomonadota bacterium]
MQNIQFCSSSRKAIILTTGIHLVFRGLKFEPDDEIEQKGALFKGLERQGSGWGSAFLRPLLGKFAESFVVKQGMRDIKHALETFKHVLEA